LPKQSQSEAKIAQQIRHRALHTPRRAIKS
jgi:hypothetical protein